MGALGRITKKMNKAKEQRRELSPLSRVFAERGGYRPGELTVIPSGYTRSGFAYSVGDHMERIRSLNVDMEISRHDLDERLGAANADIVFVDELEQVVPPHGNKYPKHQEARKGSIFQGVCNRTACDNVDARHYNKGTFGYYCAPCGWAINGRKTGEDRLCIEVDHNLTHAEMNELYGRQKF